MLDFFDNDEWKKFREKCAFDAKDDAEKKKKFDRFMQRLKKEKEPFKKREQTLRAEKRERGESDELTTEELNQIWQGFGDIQKKTVEEIYVENNIAERIGD